MENKIIALNAELELVKEANRVKYDQLMEKVNSLINHLILSGTARLIRSWADTDFNNEVFFRFEVGFHNHEKNDIDWGSEIDLTYESRTGMLSINHGCIGTFNRTNECQFRRAALITDVFNKINLIESEFAKLVDFATEALDRNDEWKIESEIRAVESQIKDMKLAEIEADFEKGLSIMYVGDIPHRVRLFNDTLTVVRCTPKFVILNDKNNCEVRLKKADLVNHIYRGYIGCE